MAKFPQKISLRVLGLISLSLVWLAFPSMAHNGAATLVYPLEGITIDGDLSDWPDDMARYPVAVPFVTLLPADTLDYRASFRIGYDRQALYVAVEAQDESVVLDSVGTPFTQDGCALFLDVEHLEGAYGDSQVEKVYRRLWGDHRRNLHPGDQVEVHREGGRQVYEWRLSLPEDIAETRPVVLGFGLALIDKDEGEPGGIFYWAGYGHNKLGDVMLVDQQTPVGKLKAKVAWRQSGAAGQVYVAVRSQDAPERWVLARSDREGAFELELPAGRYQAVVRLGWEEGAVKEVEIPAGGEVETELTADYPAGRRVEAGPGKKVTAGAGFRQGAWLSFDVVDGLNSPWIKSLYLDREGVLWLGTDGGGVSRYDGQYFTTFAEADSLAANVWAIAQDGNGDMWFGTDRGASRYDGRYFTHFAAADGLLGRQVFAILPGREGNLWFGTLGAVTLYDGESFFSYSSEDGVPHDWVESLL